MNNPNSNKSSSTINKELKDSRKNQEDVLLQQLKIIGIDNISQDLRDIVALLLGEDKMNELRTREET